MEHHCDVVAHRRFATPFDAGPDDDLADLEAATDLMTEGADPDDVPLPLDAPRNGRLARLLYGSGPLPHFEPRATPWGEEGFRPGEGELEAMRGWDAMSKLGLLSLTPTVRVDDLQMVRLGRRDWQVIHTPGHTGDHICLFDPADGVLLSGDHVLPTITPHISGLTTSPDSLAEFVAALHRVAALPGVSTVLPAHGLPFHDLTGRVDDIVGHHVERLAQLERIADELGDAPVRDYSQRLFQERSWGPMAESETYAHLEHLMLTGRMRSHPGSDGRLRYVPLSDRSSTGPIVGNPRRPG